MSSRVQIEAIANFTDQIAGFPPARRGLQQRIAPDETEKFAIMSRWVRALTSSTNFQNYPRRLIAVGTASESAVANIRVVEKASLSRQDVQYGVLIYRWGAQNNLKTMKKTLDDHQKGIPMTVLPKTLRDAMTVTCRLLFRYMWIDSLCIIQDDPSDWATEAAHMGDIYMNSTFTITGHAAEYADDGFLE